MELFSFLENIYTDRAPESEAAQAEIGINSKEIAKNIKIFLFILIFQLYHILILLSTPLEDAG